MHPLVSSLNNQPIYCYSFVVPIKHIGKLKTHSLKQTSNTGMSSLKRPQFRAKASPTSQVESYAATSEDQHRKLWTDYFLNYEPEVVEMQVQMELEVNELKEDVRKELWETIAHKPILQQLEFIDNIQRLGVEYHFEDEIRAALSQIYELHYRRHDHYHDLNLYHASLAFRLLRQSGFYVPCDIFKHFLDKDGNFVASLTSDVEAMLSLYEASYYAIHGEEILDKALAFATTQLKSMAPWLCHPLVVEKVNHALDQPLRKGFGPLESRHYISQYEHNPFYSKTLVKFAKLDFNLLQSMHKKELAYLQRWCCDLDIFPKLPYKVREVLLEIYFVALGTMDKHPEYSFGRIIYTKLVVVGTIIDDLYDLCDIPDLEVLTEAIQRWNKGCVKQLPHGLKLAYTKLLDVFEEVEQELAREGRSNNFKYALESYKLLWRFHLQSSKWSREEDVPPFDVYMTTAMQTIGVRFLTLVGVLGLGSEIATQQVFEWGSQFPKVIQAVCKLARIQDDCAEDDPMEKNATYKPSAVSCYMEQQKIQNKKEAYEELRKMCNDAWKDINQAMLLPTEVPMPVLKCILLQAQCYHLLYKYGPDGFTESNKTPLKNIFTLLFRDPIQMSKDSSKL